MSLISKPAYRSVAPLKGLTFVALLGVTVLCGCDQLRKSLEPSTDPSDAGTATSDEPDSNADAGTEVLPPIHFALTVHLEGHPLATEEAVTRYFENIQAYADLAMEHGLPVTWEVRNILEHLEAGTNHLLVSLQAEGHGVGFHADSGGSRMNQAQFELDLQEGADTLRALGIDPHHVSGICSDKDWIAAASSANFKAVTGIIDYCLKSMPLAEQPAHVSACTNPADCHDPYAYEPSEALFVWKAENGSNWPTPQEEGVLMIPSSGTITCAAELADPSVSSPTGCDFRDNDVSTVLDYIDEALTYREPDRFHQLTFVWSFGAAIPMGRFKSLLEGIQTRTETGELLPVTTPKMMLKYEQHLGNRLGQ